jgi:hypothetical protein
MSDNNEIVKMWIVNSNGLYKAVKFLLDKYSTGKAINILWKDLYNKKTPHGYRYTKPAIIAAINIIAKQ